MGGNDAVHSTVRNSQYDDIPKGLLEIMACIGHLLPRFFKVPANSLAHIAFSKNCNFHNYHPFYLSVTLYVTYNIAQDNCNVNTYIYVAICQFQFIELLGGADG